MRSILYFFTQSKRERVDDDEKKKKEEIQILKPRNLKNQQVEKHIGKMQKKNVKLVKNETTLNKKIKTMKVTYVFSMFQ